MCVRQSIFYVCVTCCDLDVTVRRYYKEEQEKARGKNNDLSHVPSKRNEEIKSGTSGCGSFVVPYFQPATSTTDHLQMYERVYFTPCHGLNFLVAISLTYGVLPSLSWSVQREAEQLLTEYVQVH